MNSDNQPPLFEPDGNLPPDPFPRSEFTDRTCHLYVASALTRLSEASGEDARLLESELHAITQAISSLDYDGLGFSLETYAPIEHSSAHRHQGLTPEQVFRQNCLEVLTRSDALIVHGWQPGAGVGQEFAWAVLQAAIPVLWVQHGDHPVSRQILGTPGDVTFERFERPAQLVQIVQGWARSRRAVLSGGPYRRSNRALRWHGPTTAARRRWLELEDHERQRICATGNVVPSEVEQRGERAADLREDHRSDVAEGSVDPLGGNGPDVLTLRGRIDLESVGGIRGYGDFTRVAAHSAR
ncbi:MAG: hypothetical protein WD250_10030 [Egibacteraceae bacterium]